MDASLDKLGVSTSLSALDGGRLAQTKRVAAQGDEAEAAKGFEKMLAMMLVKEMRKSLDDGLFGSGAGSDVYESWFDEHVADSLAERDALGMSQMIRTSLSSIEARAAQNREEGR